MITFHICACASSTSWKHWSLWWTVAQESTLERNREGLAFQHVRRRDDLQTEMCHCGGAGRKRIACGVTSAHDPAWGEPHDPYMAYLYRRGLAAEHIVDFAKRRGRGPDGYTTCSPKTNVLIRENYTAMVENIDRWVGIYLDRLRERGELENTLVVFCSDHGEMLGDHNLWGKSVPFQPAVSVPLIVSGPGVKKAGSSDVLVSTMDLTATFLDYAGVPRPEDMDSLSLRPVLEGKTTTHRQAVSSGLGRWRMVFDGRYKLIRGFDPKQPGSWRRQWDQLRFVKPADEPLALFDLEADPLENHNLVINEP